MNLIVSEIADNTALITSEQQTGTTFGAKVIEFYPVADIGFDYNIEVKTGEIRRRERRTRISALYAQNH